MYVNTTFKNTRNGRIIKRYLNCSFKLVIYEFNGYGTSFPFFPLRYYVLYKIRLKPNDRHNLDKKFLYFLLHCQHNKLYYKNNKSTI